MKKYMQRPDYMLFSINFNCCTKANTCLDLFIDCTIDRGLSKTPTSDWTSNFAEVQSSRENLTEIHQHPAILIKSSFDRLPPTKANLFRLKVLLFSSLV